MADGADDGDDFFQVRESLWSSICAVVHPSELEEVRRVIGSECIETNEDIFREVRALYDILQDFQQQNANLRAALSRRPRLPEPPSRQLLERQILLLLDSIKAHHRGSSAAALATTSCRDKEVHDFVLHKHKRRASGASATGASSGFDPFGDGFGVVPSSRRPGSGDSRPSSSRGGTRSTRLQRVGSSDLADRPSTSCSSRPSTARSGVSMSSAPETLEAMKDSLNVYAVEKVAKSLRALFAEEEAELLLDVEYLQGCLEMEHTEISEEKREAEAAPPSLNDMREFSSKLEQTWLAVEAEAERETMISKRPNAAAGAVKRETCTAREGGILERPDRLVDHGPNDLSPNAANRLKTTLARESVLSSHCEAKGKCLPPRPPLTGQRGTAEAAIEFEGEETKKRSSSVLRLRQRVLEGRGGALPS